MGALSNYFAETTDLLHDQNALFTSTTAITRYINEARRQAAQRTGCIRRLVSGQSAFGASSQPGIFIPGAAQPGALPGAIPGQLPAAGGSPTLGPFSPGFSPGFGPLGTSGVIPITPVTGAAVNTLQTIPGVERYPFHGFFNPYLKAQYAGCDAIIDVAGCSVNWGGAVRPTLAWLPWDDLQAYARAYATLVTSYPYYWSVMNDGEHGEVWMFPAPSTTGDIEIDAYVIPINLYTQDDVEAIPPGFRNAIKYGAASLAFLAKFNYMQAQIMENMFADRLGVARVAVDRGKTPNMYWGAFR